jgi:hypothetical protein
VEELKLNAGELKTAQQLIDKSAPRTTTLRKLYGNAWTFMESPTDFGTRFRASVAAGELRDIGHVGKNSANALLYSIKGG